MRDIPIIYSGPMVRALWEDRKFMTRRMAWATPARKAKVVEPDGHRHTVPMAVATSWQRVKPGDRLWVREAMHDKDGFRYAADDAPINCANAPADFQTTRTTTMPSIFMPRWASRLTLIVTATKIERLQDIPLLDVRAEGCEVRHFWLFGADAKERQRIGANVFRNLWSDLHGPDSWDANPEVVCLSFKVHKVNIDALPKAEAA